MEVRYVWIPLDDSICKSITNVFESNKKLTEENEILRELVDKPDGAGAKFSYEQICKVLK